jgi:crotonobetainyl-CoA:carnitine CoA-transferase CaiB-like acyl-CoA transferase
MLAADTFRDLVVLDLATLNAAPQVATFFADLGARVIKVEPPSGDPLRRLLDDRGVALQWQLANRNKHCVTLDLTQPAGRAVLQRLLARADLAVSAFAAPRLVRYGLDPATLRAECPRLVAVNLTTFGTSGPWGERPGSGTLAEAASGLAHLTGAADGPPTLAPVGLGDHLGVLHGIIAALVGLLARPRSGGMQFDAAMTDALLGLMGQRLSLAARTGIDPGRHGNRFPTMAPRNAYEAADGRWVAITAGTDDLAHRLFTAMDQPELAVDPRFRTHRARLANADALDDLLVAWIAAQPAASAVERLLAARVSAATIDDLPTVLRNPHFAARGTWQQGTDPHAGTWLTTTTAPGLGGEIRFPGGVAQTGGRGPGRPAGRRRGRGDPGSLRASRVRDRAGGRAA